MKTFLDIYLEALPNHKKDYEGTPIEENLHSSVFGDIYGPESDWAYDMECIIEQGGDSHYTVEDVKKEIEFFKREDIQSFGFWSCWSDEEANGATYETGYFDFETKVIEECNLAKITPRLFWDEEAKIGYYIEEYASHASPQYYNWFFEK